MNKIHPTAIIGTDVVLGDQNVIGPHVVIAGNTLIGDGNWIGPGTSIGIEGDILGQPDVSDDPFWNTSKRSSTFGVRIGSNNVIKEYVTIHCGSHRLTEIGNECYLMPRSHLGHDCWLGDKVLLSPSAQLAGHVSIGSWSVIGMGALVHQFSNIGPVAMVAMGCRVRGQVEPCRTVIGEPHRVSGINKVGIQRLVGVDDLSLVLHALKNKDHEQSLPSPLGEMVIEWNSRIVKKDQ